MRLLPDECVDECLRHLSPSHDCSTARYAGLAGLSNGALLQKAESAGFDAVIAADQNIPDQQNQAGRRICHLVLCASTNRLADLKHLVPSALGASSSIEPGEVVRIR